MNIETRYYTGYEEDGEESEEEFNERYIVDFNILYLKLFRMKLNY